VLSRFCGAAQQLDAAVMVNPHDSDAMAEAMQTALTMSLVERQERWQSMWAAIEHRSPLVWGRSFLTALLQAASAATAPERPNSLTAGTPLGRSALPAGRLAGGRVSAGGNAVADPRALN
jgi:hypothetical protein